MVHCKRSCLHIHARAHLFSGPDQHADATLTYSRKQLGPFGGAFCIVDECDFRGMDSQLDELRLNVGVDIFEEDYFLFRFLGSSIFILVAGTRSVLICVPRCDDRLPQCSG